MSIEQLARPEIRALRPYFPATASGTPIKLNFKVNRTTKIISSRARF